MSNWASTTEWAGSGPHVKRVLDGACCPGGSMEPVDCKVSQMTMIDRDNGELLQVFKCSKCGCIFFQRPGMTGFFKIQPCRKDPFRG